GDGDAVSRRELALLEAAPRRPRALPAAGLGVAVGGLDLGGGVAAHAARRGDGRPRLQHSLWRCAMSRALTVRLLVAASAFALSGCMNLDGFLFNPTRVDAPYNFDEASPELDGDLDPEGPHASLVPAALRTEGFVESAEGDQIHWVFASRPGARDTILYSHGNAHHLARYWDRVELLWQGGFNVMIYDYPGYGRSSGSPSEPGLLASAEAALTELLQQPGVNPDRIFVVGFSLGGAATY